MGEGAGRVRCAAAAAGWAGLLLAGCATVPTSGPVQVAHRVPRAAELDQPDVRMIPNGPGPGLTPEQILRGFLRATAGPANDHSVARGYLTAAEQARWNDSTGVAIYDPASVRVTSPTPTLLHVELRRIATINADGGYAASPDATGTPVTMDLPVASVEGQWRLAQVPDGLLLTPYAVEQLFRPVIVHFLGPGRDVLVPERVFVSASRPALATALIRTLLAGPTQWLQPAVRTPVPAGTTLLGSVVVNGGVAEVNLSRAAEQAVPTDRAALSAQIVWTLRQLPEVTGVRLEVEGRPFAVPGVGAVQPRDAWPSFDPAGVVEAGSGYFVAAGQLRRFDAGRLPGTAGGDPVAPARPALPASLGLLAGLVPGPVDTALTVGPLRGPARVRLRADFLSAPSWGGGRYGVWVLSGAGGQRIVTVPGTGDLQEVEAPQLIALGPVQTLRVSRDDSRVAVIAGSEGARRLYLGRVTPNSAGKLRLDGLHVVSAALADVRDVAWADGSRLAVLAGSGGARPAPYLLADDGSQLTPVPEAGLPADPDGEQIAAAPNQPLALTAAGQVWLLDAGQWRSLGPGADPGYPG